MLKFENPMKPENPNLAQKAEPEPEEIWARGGTSGTNLIFKKQKVLYYNIAIFLQISSKYQVSLLIFY